MYRVNSLCPRRCMPIGIAEWRARGESRRSSHPSSLTPNPSSVYTSSDAAKKNATSIAAFSAESDPWMALRSMDVP